MGVPVTRINKLGEGSPHVVDLIRKRRCDLVINTPTGSGARADGYEIRTAAVRHGIPCVTTMTGATAAARAIAAGQQGDAEVRCIQEIHGGRRRAPPQPAMTAPLRPPALRGRATNRASGGYRVFSLLDREGPEPRPGQFYMLAASAAGGSGGGRPFLPRAISVAETAPAAERRPPRLPGRGRRPRHRPALRARARRGGLGDRPARQRLRRAAGRSARAPPARSSSAAASASPRWPCCAAASPNGACRCASCSASATSEHSGGLELFCGAGGDLCPEVRLATEDGHAGHRGYVTDLLATMLAGDDAGSRRRLLLRPAGDAGGGRDRSAPSAASPASWRWSRRWPAATAPASAARCPKPDGGYLRLCVDGPRACARRATVAEVSPCLISAASSSPTR